MLEVLGGIWQIFYANILTKPHFFIGFMVLLGYLLLRKSWYETLSGTIKAIVGFMILSAGSGGLVVSFRPILVGLRDKFHLSAMVIDPYFGQNAVQAGVEKVFGKSFSNVVLLLAIAFITNLILVRFSRITKLRSVFTTGHVQLQQASTAYWLILFALPALVTSDVKLLIVMAVILGLYWAVGSNLLVRYSQELTDGAGFTIAHQQMFGIALFTWLAEKMAKRDRAKGKTSSKRIEDIELPGWMSIFNDNMVATGVLMLMFFGGILLALGKPFLIEAGFMKPGQNLFFYIVETSLKFAVYLAILQLGVRTFISELTQSFKGISDKLLPGAVPGVDCAISYNFGSPNAITIGFLAGAIGQGIAIATLIALKSPVLVVAGFVPVFFDNATIGVYANNKGGLKATLIFPFIAGLCQVFGSAFIASWVGMAAYGGYLGMWDWAVVWPVFTVIMKYLSYAGVALIVIVLILIPQLQYLKDKENYFLITEDFEEYKRRQEEKGE
ncbi:PTS ascorbate transporter subunit IIC [Oceanivirga miroungae]|uniref:Ascorbate-specific PTS system EIIC component n=1 Tax=Oceanivirga miroungae TaxID=1130046 RepID=A0A6I8MEN5_9FUSO|nr:PTS ascorbate transporter subunit IIC [Oceanivirga miroungae]VWL85689.1 sugar-specific permease SgaT/UlaA [Oceanivirga miroungae]